MLGKKHVFVVVLAMVGSIVATGGPAGSADRDRHRPHHRDKERQAGKRHQGHPAGQGMPARFVAEAGGRIVVVSVDGGRVEHHLTDEPSGRDGAAGDPALGADGRTVWFSRGDGRCSAHLASVPVEGGREEKVPGSGEAGAEQRPLPRPGRAQIAFARTDCKEPAESLVVGDLAGLEGYGQSGLLPMEWSRNGRHLLAEAADASDVHRLTVNDNGAIVGDVVLNPTDGATDCRVEVVGFSPDGNDGYVAVRRCGRPGENARRSLVLLDENGKRRTVLVRLPRGVEFVDGIAFDRTGHSLLYSTIPSEVRESGRATDPEVTLWVWRDGESRRVIRNSPYRAPVWLP